MSLNRFYSEFDTEQRNPRWRAGDEHRSPYQIDRDRILHSSALRRLQGKTQVFYSFLIGDHDFYRTRLTHSLEVAQIGRSICGWLEKNSDLLEPDCQVDADLVEAACLAHDLGHPPFGHTGERALHDLMADYGGFEGNAQTLRQLTETLFVESRDGMNPTRALLDAVLKYKTLQIEVPRAKNHYLYNEQERHLDFVLGSQAFPMELTPGKERNGFRSLECQIMDWADDTAYSINDLADAIQTGFITMAKLEAWAEKQSLNAAESEHLHFLLQAMREEKVEARLGRSIGEHIRACTLGLRSNFLSGSTKRYQLELRIDPATEAKAKLNKRIAVELVFETPQLHQLDFKARQILERLFVVLQERYIERTSKHRLQLLPVEAAQHIEQEEDKGMRARLVCDWLANLTDRSAIRAHQRLFDTGANESGML
jgi:dGTPase